MQKTRIRQLESRALLIAMIGSLFMGAAGVTAALLSNSTAIMMDGLYSLVGFTAGFIGRKISLNSGAPPDRIRPLGYAADEALFVTFRSLSLLGVILFAVGAAGMNIFNYANGGRVPELHFGPLLVYFVVIGFTCFGLWGVHRYVWSRTGKASDILRLEAKSAMIDGLFTVAAGVGLGAIYWFGDGILAPIAPIGDSLVVLILCLVFIGQIWRELLGGMGELLGVTAKPKVIATARRAIRASLMGDNGTLTDLSVVKSGRTYLVSVYFNPGRAMVAQQIDAMNLRMIHEMRKVLPNSDVLLCVSELPRRWPDGTFDA